jgi:nitrogen regulatory protein P-II 1
MFMIMFVLNDPNRCQEILDAWETAGASGITILPSTGLGRVRRKMGLSEDVPLMPSLEDFFQLEENLHRTIITVSRDRAVIDRVIQSTQAVVGDLNEPDTGILMVLPLLEVYGLDRNSR